MHVFVAGIYHICSVNLILPSSLFIGKANTCCFRFFFLLLSLLQDSNGSARREEHTNGPTRVWVMLQSQNDLFFFRSRSQPSDSPTAILCRVRSTVTILCNNVLNVDSTPAPRTTTALHKAASRTRDTAGRFEETQAVQDANLFCVILILQRPATAENKLIN